MPPKIARLIYNGDGWNDDDAPLDDDDAMDSKHPVPA
jgi:hypothetical protein